MKFAPARYALLAAFMALPSIAVAFEYPTKDRVEYVLECMQEKSDKPAQEMLYKCSCAIDEIRKKLTYNKFVEMATSAKAISIAGDRSMRDSEPAQAQARKYRELQAKAYKSCYIN
jgi:hypothetical protein